MRSLRSAVIDTLILVILCAGGYAAYANHDRILDWYYLRNYTPPPRIAALADQATMTDTGRKLFYRSRPQIDSSREELVQHCNIPNDKTIELGCYLSSNQIYLMDIVQPELQSEMAVTAAHETLHAAYERLSRSERQRLDAELEAYADTITDADFRQRMAEYAQTEPGERDNELHSIIGTEYSNLPPSLANHYAQYFSDRSKIVAASDQFSSTFDGLHAEIVQLDTTIKALRGQMEAYLATNQINRYNSLVPVINDDINRYNQKVSLYNQYASTLLGKEPTAGAQ